MPQMILLPDDDGTSSSDWIASGTGISERWEALVDINGDNSYVKCDDNNEAMIIEFANPGVAEAIIDFNEEVTVRFLSSGRSTDRRNAAGVDIAFQVPSGFSETVYYDPSPSSYESITGTARTTQPDTSAWDYAALENLEMICTKNGAREVYLTYLSIRIDYTEAVAADNATFFGANF